MHTQHHTTPCHMNQEYVASTIELDLFLVSLYFYLSLIISLLKDVGHVLLRVNHTILINFKLQNILYYITLPKIGAPNKMKPYLNIT